MPKEYASLSFRVKDGEKSATFSKSTQNTNFERVSCHSEDRSVDNVQDAFSVINKMHTNSTTQTKLSISNPTLDVVTRAPLGPSNGNMWFVHDEKDAEFTTEIFTPTESIQAPETQRCPGISEYLPIDSEGRIYAVQVFTSQWTRGNVGAKNWVGGLDGSGFELTTVADDRGTFGAEIPFGINDTRSDQSAHPPGASYSTTNAGIKSSYVILKDDDVHQVPAPYSQKLENDEIGIASVMSFMDGLSAFGLLHGVGKGTWFGTMIVPPGWQVDVWNQPGYGCRKQFSGIKGPFIFHEARPLWVPSPSPVPSSVLETYANQACPTWNAFAHIKGVPVVGLRDSYCSGDSISYGVLPRWEHNAGTGGGSTGRRNGGGYSFKFKKIPIDDRSGSYTQLGPGYHDSRTYSN